MFSLLYGDLSERDIGRELYVAPSTVHSHVRAIYRKLAVGSRADALEHGPRTRPLLASTPGITLMAPSVGVPASRSTGLAVRDRRAWTGVRAGPLI